MPYLIGHPYLSYYISHLHLDVVAFLGINLFFVLSAFLITFLIYEERLATGQFSFTKYYLRRTLRIWPLYFFIVFCGFVLVPAFKHLQGIQYQETANVWYYIFFISNFHIIYLGEPFSPVLAVLWTAAAEEQFYLVWPILNTIFSKGREIILFLILIAGSLLFRYFHLTNGREIYFNPLSIMSDFGIGALIAYMSFKKNKLFQFLSGLSKGIIAAIYLCMLLLVCFEFKIFHYSVLYVFERCIWGLFTGFIIFEQCFCKNSLFKVGNVKLFDELGKRSYGLYCFHQIGILGAINILRYSTRFNFSLHQLYTEPLLALSITVVLAYLSYSYFEMPFLKLKNKFGF